MINFNFTFKPFDVTIFYTQFENEYKWGWITKEDLANDVRNNSLPASEYERITGEKYVAETDKENA